MENKNDEEYLKLDLSSLNEDETKALISRTEKCMRLLAEAMRLENDYSNALKLVLWPLKSEEYCR